MIDPWRIVPTLVLTGGLAAAAGPTLDLVKASLSHYELVQIANLMLVEWNVDCRVPPRTNEQLAAFIEESVETTSGRDVTNDFWGNPYRVRWSAMAELVLYSTGPNGEQNGCGEVTWQQALTDRIQDMIAQAADDGGLAEGELASPSRNPRETMNNPPAGADDVCVRVTLEPCQGNGRADSRGNPALEGNLPFR